MTSRLILLCLLTCAVGSGQRAIAADGADPGEPLTAYVASNYAWHLPGWMPRPLEPRDNPTTADKVEPGSDGLARSPGALGQLTPRNSMSLANVAYSPVLTWSNPLLHSIERQILVPLLGDEPVELGMGGHDEELISRLQAEPLYPPLFAQAFPESHGAISLASVTRALAAFVRTLIAADSPYDRYRNGADAHAISAAAIRGETLFFSERLECHHCHGNFNFNDSLMHERNRIGEIAFHNTGLYNLDDKGAYPADNAGLAEITGRAEDMGRFRAPTLRNISVTAPYMHDGSIATLDGVIDHYAAGGRTIANGPNAGVGHNNPLKSSFMPGFPLTAKERADLLAFLNSLTDLDFLIDPRFSDPWTEAKALMPGSSIGNP